MKVWTEIDSISEFDAWGGAVDTINGLTLEQQDCIDGMLDEIFPEGCSVVELNDWLSFEDDYIATLLGFEDWEDLEAHNNGEDEDEEDEEDE